MRELKLSYENTIVHISDLNGFCIGDQVIADEGTDHYRFEGVIIGIELRRVYGSERLEPCITLLHDGCITDEFKPNDLRKVDPPAPQPNVKGCHPTHVTRFSDASSYDEVCTNCGATDIAGGGWGKLGEPCPSPQPNELPTREEVRNALETLARANGADLDEWTCGHVPDDLDDALRAIRRFDR